MPKIAKDKQGFTTLDGVRVIWDKNVDERGARSFYLPGETSLNQETFKRRSREYYRQTRGATRRTNPSIALAAIQEARRLLAPYLDPPDS